jgi:acetyl/propionyl-CoA carboxylase alpha subunit
MHHVFNHTEFTDKLLRNGLSRHIVEADEAINLGHIDQEGGNPFLNINLLTATAVDAGADAIHPGYGYLSENAEFADAVRRAGLTFIGPSSAAMSTLGDKRSAKAYLRRHDPQVPLIPGFAGSSQDVSELEAAAGTIGFPVMLKASAGGGGRGMRIVRQRSHLRGELERAQSEAARSFGSSDCILEKYIEAGKHIEIQIIGDSHGNVVSLWERECSIQRRHQKVIEETPSPWLTPQKRLEMSNVAVRIGKLLGYENAGTVEFVVDVTDGSFYFLEVNTRLQVEHPITEEVTGIDVVSLQLFVAAGGDLTSLSILENVPQRGHAIECRLCAEDPQREFFPEHGTVRLWQPANAALPDLKDVRFETAIETGCQVSIYFDSMIAKIVVWAPTRSAAIDKMVKVLSRTVCAGVKTNQLFLQSCLLHEGFREPAYTTSFIPSNLQTLLRNPYLDPSAHLNRALPLVACLFLRNVGQYLLSAPAAAARPFRHVRRGFRNQAFDAVNKHSDIVVTSGLSDKEETLLCTWTTPRQPESAHLEEAKIGPLPSAEESLDDDPGSTAPQVTARYNAISNALRSGAANQGQAYKVAIESCQAATATSPMCAPWIHATMTVSINGKLLRASLATESCDTGVAGTTQMGQGQRVMCHVPRLGSWIEFRCFNALSFCESIREVAEGGSAARLKTATAPMPCKVLSVLKNDGDEVRAGESVMVVESMKMEINISMSVGGSFEAMVRKHDAVDEGTVLCRVV